MFKVLMITAIMTTTGIAAAYGPCDADIEKLCDGKFHGETAKTCLHSQVEKLSPECQAFVKTKDGDWQKDSTSLAKVKEACAKEGEKHCPEAKETRKPFVVCIMAHAEVISEGCKKELNRHIGDHMPNIKPL